MQKYFIYLKSILISVLLLSLIWGSIEAALLLRQSRQSIANTDQTISGLVSDARGKLSKFDSPIDDIASIAHRQREELEAPGAIRSRGLLLRTGDDVNRTVKKLNIILDHLNQQTLPRGDNVLDATSTTIVSANGLVKDTSAGMKELRDQIEENGQAMRALLDESSSTAKEFRGLLADPNIKRVIAGMADTSENSAQLAHSLNLTVTEVNEHLPTLLAALKATSENTAEGTKQLATLIGTFNERPTRLQRIYRTLITLGVVAAKVAVQ